MHPSPACPELCRREFWILPKMRNEPNPNTANSQSPKARKYETNPIPAAADLWRTKKCETNPIYPYPSLAQDRNMRNEPNFAPTYCLVPRASFSQNEPNSHIPSIPPPHIYAKRTQSTVSPPRIRITSADYDPSIAKFDYTYVANENNIYRKTFDHRTNDEYNQYAYDDLDRLTAVTYHDSDAEAFNMDVLGNRDGDQTLRDDGTVNFTVNDDTNRYTAIGGNSISHDNAGNTIVDQNGYQYWYDYENRIIRIDDSEDEAVATFEYDALGRRIRKVVYGSPTYTEYYYYNDKWQVLAEEYDGTSYSHRYVYGNYIDEVLIMDDGYDYYYYAHNHLFSTVALTNDTGVVVERYEYNAYGKVQIMSSAFVNRDSSLFWNPYTFTGRRLDTLDGGDLKIMYYRNRYYDTETGRFLQQDPFGIDPAGDRANPFMPLNQYYDGRNSYQYALSQVLKRIDPLGYSSFEVVEDVVSFEWWEKIGMNPGHTWKGKMTYIYSWNCTDDGAIDNLIA